MQINLLQFLLILSLFAPFKGYSDDNSTKYAIKRVVIDAGHGGKDAGAIGYSKVKEKDVVLKVTLLLGEYIGKYLNGIEVVYTRDSDEFIELYERANIANKKQADLFISIHANSSSSHTAYGTEIFVLGLHRSESNLDVAKRENSVIELEDNFESNYEFDPNSPEGHIIMSMKQNVHLDQSIDLASRIDKQFEERVQRKSRGVKQAGFLVLYKTTMPSILVELGFLSNPEEEKFLNSTQGQEYLASAIYRAFKDYKDTFEKNVHQESEKLSHKTLPTEDISFRIQIYASDKDVKLKHKIYKDFDDIVTDQSEKGIYRYMIGNYKNYDEAKKMLSEIHKSGYKDAFLTAYNLGKRISVISAKQLLTNR